MKKLLSVLFWLLPLLASAHPNHDGEHDGGYTIIHYLTTPVHAAPIIATVALVGFLAWRRRQRHMAELQTETAEKS